MGIEIIGWLASFFFSICGLPQAILSHRSGKSEGVSSLFLWLWLLGELFMLAYMYLKYTWDGPVMINLIVNTSFILVILKYKYFPRKENNS